MIKCCSFRRSEFGAWTQHELLSTLFCCQNLLASCLYPHFPSSRDGQLLLGRGSVPRLKLECLALYFRLAHGVVGEFRRSPVGNATVRQVKMEKIKFKLVWVEWNQNWYFREMSASETYLVSFFALGEGWHNYHVNQRATRFVCFVINRNFVYSSTAFHGITELRSLHFTGSMFQQCSLISLLS